MNAKAIFNAVMRHLKKTRTPYVWTEIPDGYSIYCPILPGPAKLDNISQTIETWNSRMRIYAHALIHVAPEYIDEVAKFVALANYGLCPGNFDLDVSTGEVRFRHFLDCEGYRRLPDAVLQRTLALPLLMLRLYGDALVSVATGTLPATSALSPPKNPPP